MTVFRINRNYIQCNKTQPRNQVGQTNTIFQHRYNDKLTNQAKHGKMQRLLLLNTGLNQPKHTSSQAQNGLLHTTEMPILVYKHYFCVKSKAKLVLANIIFSTKIQITANISLTIYAMSKTFFSVKSRWNVSVIMLVNVTGNEMHR